jgi:hypothetical protein
MEIEEIPARPGNWLVNLNRLVLWESNTPRPCYRTVSETKALERRNGWFRRILCLS